MVSMAPVFTYLLLSRTCTIASPILPLLNMVNSKSLNLLRQIRQAIFSSSQRRHGHLAGRLGGCLPVTPTATFMSETHLLNACGSDYRRCFASGQGGSKNNKKQAMKQQMERHQPSPPAGGEASSPLRPSTGRSFPAYTNEEDPFLSNSLNIPQRSAWTPLQASPLLSKPTWETDKSRLSSLPDDAAMLLDKEELFDPSIHLPYAPKDWTGYEPATPLSDFLMQRIGVAGRPITVAEYMRHALTHPQYGYYTNPSKSKAANMNVDGSDDFDHDEWNMDTGSATNTGSSSANTSTLIGPRGDFVTAPEVTHVFGHCLCVWFVTQWKSNMLNQHPAIQLAELGPGRGTLMVDILQLATTSKLQDFGRAIKVVNLIEASQELRSQQEAALQASLGHLVDFEFVHVSAFPSSDDKDAATLANTEQKSSSTQSTNAFTIRVEWHDTFSSFQRQRNKDMPVFMVLQEFLDALPVHSFQKTHEGWRERLIDVASLEDEAEMKQKAIESASDANPSLLPRLRQVLAPDVTTAVELFLEPNRQYDSAPEGTVVEICPEAIVLVQDMQQVLEESRGVALMIDYGQDGTSDTLRAFSKHQQVPLTSYPGQVDVTADVDFFALRNCIANEHNDEVPGDRRVYAFGPVTQGEFLMRMGAADMIINSIEQDETTPEQAQKLTDALKYLVFSEHMGERFKVLALAPKRDGIFAPAGMET